MTTTIEYALMAGASYISTRADINKFPVPQSWSEAIEFRKSDPNTGFEATYFTQGTNIIISYAGTNPNGLFGVVDWDNVANVQLATGLTDLATLLTTGVPAQLIQAADYYLQVKAANPGVYISLTGHSLGGGLAALIGVFFGVEAHTFDQAPFANSAQDSSVLGSGNPYNLFAADYAANLKQYLQSETFSSDAPDVAAAKIAARDAMVQQLGSFLYWRGINGGIPNSDLVSTVRVDGEFTSALGVGIFDPIGNPATIIDHSPHFSPSIDLHSQALLTTFLQSDATATTVAGQKQNLSEATKKLNDLLGMFFDKNLFAHDTDPSNTKFKDFLNHLVRHQAGGVDGVSTGGDAMVTRFTSDLWKIAQDGGLTMNESVWSTYSNWNNISKALIAFAMQKYYEENNPNLTYGTELFTDLSTTGAGSNGIRFDIADVSKDFNTALQTPGKTLQYSDLIANIKGFKEYFQNYLDYTSTFTLQERTLIKSFLPTLRDWYVQAGLTGMNATDTLNRSAFMLGGSGNDILTGGTANDLLVGGAGNDTLTGGQGNDILLGGAGNDTYQYSNGASGNQDGLDIVLDSDGNGVLKIDGQTLSGGKQYGDANVYRDDNGNLYVKAGTSLIVDGNLLVLNYSTTVGNHMGLTLDGPATVASLPTLTGNDQDNFIGADIYNRDPNDPGKIILASGGQSSISIQYSNSSAAANLIEGGSGADIINGGAGNDRIYADTQIAVADAIVQGNSQTGSGLKGDWLNGGSGDDTLIGSNGNDALMGGGGNDLIVAGAGNDDIVGDYDVIAQSFAWTATLQQDGTLLFSPADGIVLLADAGADVIYAGEGNDRAWGDKGNDVIFGEGGDDSLNGDEGNDILMGGAGSDKMWGGTGNDYLDGGDGVDYLYDEGGNDIIIGGKGDDFLYGGTGADIYIYNRGDGKDHLYDTKGENNVLRFGEGISSSDIVLRLGSLMLDLGNGDAIHIDNFNRNDVFNSSSIGSFEFADGTVLTSNELLARGFDLGGTNGDDIITGTNTTDRINGLAENDLYWRIAA